MARGAFDNVGGSAGGSSTRMGMTIKGGKVDNPAYTPKSSLQKYLKNIDFSGKSVPKKADLNPNSLTPKSGMRKQLEGLNLVPKMTKTPSKVPANIDPKSMTRKSSLTQHLEKLGLKK